MADEIDPDKLRQVSLRVFSKLEGAMTAGMIHLGDRLGLYVALADADTPLTSAQLADATGLHERWVREWAYNQAAANIVDVDVDVDGDERFSLSAEGAAVLARPESPSFGVGMFHDLPQMMQKLDVVPDSFRTGVGYDYDTHGPEGAIGSERSFAPWNNAFLVPVVLEALDGVVAKLENGAAVADIGCGAGGAVLLMAGSFPRSRFTGFDISQLALERARERLAEAGFDNASFVDPRTAPLASDNSLDFVTTFDCIHDMTHPQRMMESIRQALKPDGTWLLVDIKARGTFVENARKNPMAPMMYGISVLSCLASAMSSPDGAGLGTLGLSEDVAREMSLAAGFSRFRRLAIDNPINAFYEIRP